MDAMPMNYFAIPGIVHFGNEPMSIISAVCRYYNLDYGALKGNIRSRKLAIGRHTIFKLIKDNTKLSLTEIGKFLNKDHSTVLYGIRKIENLTELYEEEREHYKAIENELTFNISCNE